MGGLSVSHEHPLPRLRRYFPQRGKILNAQIFPLWGKWREAPKGALFSVFRIPREGGENRGSIPSPNPLPQGGEGFVFLSPLPEGEGWVRALFKIPNPQTPQRD